MSSKNASETGIRRRRSYRLLRNISIAGRLTLLSTLCTFALLVLSSGYLFWFLAGNLQREDTESLADKVRSLCLQLTPPPGPSRPVTADWVPSELREMIEENPRLGKAARPFQRLFYVRVLAGRGQVLLETPGAEALVKDGVFPPPAEGGAKRTILRRQLPDGRTFWGRTEQAQCGVEHRIVQVALDRSAEERLLGEYRRVLLYVLTIGLVLSIFLGYGVTRRGMRPLAQMTEVLKAVRVPHLQRRIAADGWPRDLTALAMTFDTMMDHLEESFARMTRLSSDLAHELRTPLSSLRGEGEVALSRERSAEEYRRVIESSLEEYERLARTINSLLFLARAENLDTVATWSVFDARAETEVVLQFHEAPAAEQGITLICQGQATLRADPDLFRRAISNLVSNALQYTSAGGMITVTLRQAADEAVTVEVRDTGSGIAPEELPRVFERFYRAGSARSLYPEGSGLGLAIVRSIMNIHGGEASIHSEPGAGTTVNLHFPRPDDQITRL